MEPVFRIITHSHGGNVALWLAGAELNKKKNLKIDLLYMLGNPIQEETVSFAESLIFKNVILGYSDGDAVQTRDRFSTSSKSYASLGSLLNMDDFIKKNSGYTRCDMRFVVNHDTKQINHKNMLFFGRSRQILSRIGHLPLVVFVPAFVQALLDSSCCDTDVIAALEGQELECCTYISSSSQSRLRMGLFSDYGFIFYLEKNISKNWHPLDTSRSTIFNYKVLKCLQSAFCFWR